MDIPTLTSTKSIKRSRSLLVGIAFTVVLFASSIILFIGGGDSSFAGIVLEGEGCERVEGAEICELISEEERVTLRDCSQEDAGCEQSWYELGVYRSGVQYMLLYSEGIQMVTLLAVDPETLSVEEKERHFYTEVRPECEESRQLYEDECFDFALTEEQRQDVWETNQAYKEVIQRYQK